MNWNSFNGGWGKNIALLKYFLTATANIAQIIIRYVEQLLFLIWVKSSFILSFVPMSMCRLIICLLCFFFIPWRADSQRIYRPNSVLASGNWYKIAVTNAGVYKIDIPFLNGLGINTSGLASNSIRLFGNGGQMLSESNAGPWIDDLQENSIMIVDGGDG